MLTKKFNIKEHFIIFHITYIFYSKSLDLSGFVWIGILFLLIAIYPSSAINKSFSVRLVSLFKINPNFSVKYINSILRISLNITDIDKHFLYYLVKMLDVIE